MTDSIADELTSYFTQQTKEGYTPFHLAAFFGHADFIEHMVQTSAKALDVIDVPNDVGAAPLHLSSENGFEHVIRVLLKYDVDVNRKDKSGNTPLHYIVKTGNAKAAEELFEHGKGVDAGLLDKKNLTAAHYAVKAGDTEMLQVFARHKVHLAEPDDKGDTLLTLAVENKHWDAAACLLMNRMKTPENTDEDINKVMDALSSVQDDLLKAYLRFVRNMKNDDERIAELKKFIQKENALGAVFNQSSKKTDFAAPPSAPMFSVSNVFLKDTQKNVENKWIIAIEKEFKKVLDSDSKLRLR